MLEAANRPNGVPTITRDKTVEEATTLMMTHRYSQLPVTQDMRRIDGMISWPTATPYESVGSGMLAQPKIGARPAGRAAARSRT